MNRCCLLSSIWISHLYISLYPLAPGSLQDPSVIESCSRLFKDIQGCPGKFVDVIPQFNHIEAEIFHYDCRH
jgi:hypothetical protein